MLKNLKIHYVFGWIYIKKFVNSLMKDLSTEDTNKEHRNRGFSEKISVFSGRRLSTETFKNNFYGYDHKKMQ